MTSIFGANAKQLSVFR